MITINKTINKIITITFIILIILFPIYIITKNSEEQLNESDYENMSNNNIPNNTNELKSITEIKNPDEIIYYKDGIKVTIDKKHQNFIKIIEANKNRILNEISPIQTFVVFENDEKHEFLEYKYYDDSSIYFTLKTNTENYIWIPKDNKYFVSGAYGFIDTATELIKYLD